MASLSHKTAQTTLLIQRLLSLREGASPLNVVVDSLEQTAGPLLAEYIQRASANGDTTIFVSFEALRAPKHVTHFVKAHRTSISTIQQEVQSLIKQSSRSVVLIDSIHPFLERDPNFVTTLPSLTAVTSSLIIVYHAGYPENPQQNNGNSYVSSPLTLLTYLATTVIHVHSIAQAKVKHQATMTSRAEPAFGLDEDKDGLLVGTGANDGTEILVEMEHRRKSGRIVGLSFVLGTEQRSTGKSADSHTTLRENHPAFRTQIDTTDSDNADFSNATFNLDLTEKQRQARDGVVLPYIDAQTGGGEGGRILYEMDREDDFDDEEDEI